MITVDDFGCGGTVAIYRENEKSVIQIGELIDFQPVLKEELSTEERIELYKAIELYKITSKF